MLFAGVWQWFGQGDSIKAKVLAIALGGSLCSTHSFAEIYQCKDNQGKKVFQQVPCKREAVSKEKPEGLLWYEMRELAATGIQINSRIGPTVKAMISCNEAVERFKSEIQLIEPRVAEVQYQHEHLAMAYVALEDCARCSVSAGTDCKQVNTLLDKAMVKLLE
jgi:hypothetical protein